MAAIPKRMVMVIARTGGVVDRVTVSPATQILYERKYKVGLNALDTGESPSLNIYRLAYEADMERVRKGGGIQPDLDKWVEDIEVVEADFEAVRPTSPDHPGT